MAALLAWRDEDHEQPPSAFGTFSREAGGRDVRGACADERDVVCVRLNFGTH